MQYSLFLINRYFKKVFSNTIFMNLFSNDYLPDRLDIQDVNSIAYMEFIENQKRKNDYSFIIKLFKLILGGLNK